jgi:hypothetical protein
MEILTVEPPEIPIFNKNWNVLSFSFLLLLFCFLLCVCFPLWVCFALCVLCFMCSLLYVRFSSLALFYISIDPIFRYLSHSGYFLFVIQCTVKQNIVNFIIFNLELTIFVFRNLVLVYWLLNPVINTMITLAMDSYYRELVYVVFWKRIF